MPYVPVRTDQTAYAAVDGYVADSDTGAHGLSANGTFGTSVEVSKNGFGVVDPYTGAFEVLDALPMHTEHIQNSIERGAQALVADSDAGPAKAGFTAVDFGTADYITATEVDASAVLDSDLITTDMSS